MANTDKRQSVDKFIAFFDVLGWKYLVHTTEKKNNFSVGEAIDILDMIRSELDTCRQSLICPTAASQNPDVNLLVTSFSDSFVISSEISPAGLINLINCCRVAYYKLFSRSGLMCRGYIKRGMIYHTDRDCVGSGLIDVVEGEKQVSIFKQGNAESGTPFIEIDRNIIRYVDEEVDRQSDACVKEKFSQFVTVEDDVAAIFPFKSLDPDIFGDGEFDPEKVRKRIDTIRGWICKMKAEVGRRINPYSKSARRKERCLNRMLDAQLNVCVNREKAIEQMASAQTEIFPAHTLSDLRKQRD